MISLLPLSPACQPSMCRDQQQTVLLSSTGTSGGSIKFDSCDVNSTSTATSFLIICPPASESLFLSARQTVPLLIPKKHENAIPGCCHTTTDVTNAQASTKICRIPNKLPSVAGKDKKELLKLKLQSRRPIKQLIDQGIIPPLNVPAAFCEQKRKLERAKMGDFLKHKIQQRPDKQQLVSQHILLDSNADPGIQEKQQQLKKCKLADTLNDKISHRPGPLELIRSGVLHVDDVALEQAVKEGKLKFKPTSSGLNQKTLPRIILNCSNKDGVNSTTSSSSSSTAPSPLTIQFQLSHTLEGLSSSGGFQLSTNGGSPSSIDLPPSSNSFPDSDIGASSTVIVPSGSSTSINVPDKSSVVINNSNAPVKTASCNSNSGGSGVQKARKKLKQKSSVLSTTTAESKHRTVLRFHEYKGPSNKSPSVAAAAMKVSSTATVANNNVPSILPNKSPSNDSGVGSVNWESSSTCSSASSVNSSASKSESSYELMLQQQQLLLQWHLESQQKQKSSNVHVLPVQHGQASECSNSVACISVPVTASTIASSAISLSITDCYQTHNTGSQNRLILPKDYSCQDMKDTLIFSTFESNSTDGTHGATIIDQPSVCGNSLLAANCQLELHNNDLTFTNLCNMDSSELGSTGGFMEQFGGNPLNTIVVLNQPSAVVSQSNCVMANDTASEMLSANNAAIIIASPPCITATDTVVSDSNNSTGNNNTQAKPIAAKKNSGGGGGVQNKTTAAKQQKSDTNNNVKIVVAKIEDMRVSDLKAECKKRNLPVSGPKPNLLERLKPYEEAIISTVNTKTEQSPEQQSSDSMVDEEEINTSTVAPVLEADSSNNKLPPIQFIGLGSGPMDVNVAPVVSDVEGLVHNTSYLMHQPLDAPRVSNCGIILNEGPCVQSTVVTPCLGQYNSPELLNEFAVLHFDPASALASNTNQPSSTYSVLKVEHGAATPPQFSCSGQTSGSQFSVTNSITRNMLQTSSNCDNSGTNFQGVFLSTDMDVDVNPADVRTPPLCCSTTAMGDCNAESWYPVDKPSASSVAANALGLHENVLRQQQKRIEELQRELQTSQEQLKRQQQVILAARKAQGVCSNKPDDSTQNEDNSALSLLDTKQLQKFHIQLFLQHKLQQQLLQQQKATHQNLLEEQAKLKEELAINHAVQEIITLLWKQPRVALTILNLLRNNKPQEQVTAVSKDVMATANTCSVTADVEKSSSGSVYNAAQAVQSIVDAVQKRECATPPASSASVPPTGHNSSGTAKQKKTTTGPQGSNTSKAPSNATSAACAQKAKPAVSIDMEEIFRNVLNAAKKSLHSYEQQKKEGVQSSSNSGVVVGSQNNSQNSFVTDGEAHSENINSVVDNLQSQFENYGDCVPSSFFEGPTVPTFSFSQGSMTAEVLTNKMGSHQNEQLDDLLEILRGTESFSSAGEFANSFDVGAFNGLASDGALGNCIEWLTSMPNFPSSCDHILQSVASVDNTNGMGQSTLSDSTMHERTNQLRLNRISECAEQMEWLDLVLPSPSAVDNLPSNPPSGSSMPSCHQLEFDPTSSSVLSSCVSHSVVAISSCGDPLICLSEPLIDEDRDEAQYVGEKSLGFHHHQSALISNAHNINAVVNNSNNKSPVLGATVETGGHADEFMQLEQQLHLGAADYFSADSCWNKSEALQFGAA